MAGNNSDLPLFFQKTGKTVLDELHNPDFAENDDCELDIALSESTYAALDMNDEETFGDLQSSNLPDFLRAGTGSKPQMDDKVSPFASLLSGSPSNNDTYSTPGDKILQALLPSGGRASRPPGLGGPPGIGSGGPSAPPGLQSGSAPAPPAAASVKPVGNAWTGKPSLAASLNGSDTAQDVAEAPSASDLPPPPAPFTHPVLGSTKDEEFTQLLPPAPPVAAVSVQFGSFGETGAECHGKTESAAAAVPVSKAPATRGKFMTASDVRFITNKVLQPVESSDPFSEDFYSIQLNIKRNKAAREAAAATKAAPPPPLYVPLPTWRETKERIRSQMEQSRRVLLDKSKQWETEAQVLGHTQRADMRTPKQLLSIPKPSASAAEDEDEGAMPDDSGNDSSQPQFTSRLWTVRQAVQTGFEALYTVQELHHLSSSPAIAQHPAAQLEIQKEVEHAVALLSHSIGVRTVAGGGPNAAFSLDGGHVGAILQMAKGKKLMSRSLKLLNQSHRWALLPVVLSKILQAPVPTASATAPSSSSAVASDSVNAVDSGAIADSQTVDQKLLKTIIEFLQYSYQFQTDEQKFYMANNGPANPSIGTPFTNVFLSNLRACIQTVMVTNMEKSKLRQSLLCDRSRAQVLHLIVQIADKVKVSAGADPRLVEQWTQTREAFMALLDS